MEEQLSFSKASMRRMIDKNTGKRISDDSAIELGRILEEVGKQVCAEADKKADHANRKTIHESDIKLGLRALDNIEV